MKPKTEHSTDIKADKKTQDLMLDIFIALAPCAIFGAMLFGWKALATMVVCVAAALAGESVFCDITKKKNNIGNLKSAVIGFAVALTLSAETPFLLSCLASVVAVVAGTLLFDGVAGRFVNPIAAVRVLLTAAAFPLISVFKEPFSDLVTTATPMAAEVFSVKEAAMGVCSGSIGETSSVMILLGGLYLFARKLLKPEIPLAILGSSALAALVFGQNILTTLFGGGLMFAAVFFSIDTATTPKSLWGRIVFGCGVGIITVVLRAVTPVNEGVAIAFIIMNLVSRYIDTGISYITAQNIKRLWQTVKQFVSGLWKKTKALFNKKQKQTEEIE